MLVLAGICSRKFISANSADYTLSTLLDTSVYKGVCVCVNVYVYTCMYVPKNLQFDILKKNLKVFWILLSSKKKNLYELYKILENKEAFSQLLPFISLYQYLLILFNFTFSFNYIIKDISSLVNIFQSSHF